MTNDPYYALGYTHAQIQVLLGDKVLREIVDPQVQSAFLNQPAYQFGWSDGVRFAEAKKLAKESEIHRQTDARQKMRSSFEVAFSRQMKAYGISFATAQNIERFANLIPICIAAAISDVMPV